MDQRPQQPAEGKLLADALERSGLSIREASRRAGISYGRWRQIASGVQNASPGSWARVTGPAKTVARMARVVNVSADAMAAAGREDVADILREAPASQQEATPDAPPADTPEVVAANWGDATVRQLWQGDGARKMEMILFYLAVAKVTRERTDAEVTEMRQADGA